MTGGKPARLVTVTLLCWLQISFTFAFMFYIVGDRPQCEKKHLKPNLS